MDHEQIKALALAHGFELKPQGTGQLDLHANIYLFAEAVAQHAIQQALPAGAVVLPYEVAEAGHLALHAAFVEWDVMTHPPEYLKQLKNYSRYMQGAKGES